MLRSGAVACVYSLRTRLPSLASQAQAASRCASSAGPGRETAVMYVDGAAGSQDGTALGLWRCAVGVALDCAASGLHLRLRRPVQAVRGSTCAEWLAAAEGMRLARQLELGSLVLFTDSKSVAKQREPATATRARMVPLAP